MHFDQLVEKSTQINQENLALKQRVNELEKKSQIDASLIEEKIKAKYEKHMQQVEQDQDTIESQNITIQNMQVLTSDLKDQLNGVENLFMHEKNATKSLQSRLEGLVSANKENLESLKCENNKHDQQMEGILEQRLNYEKQIQNSATKIQQLEMDKVSLNTELESSNKENERLVEKLKEYEDIIAILKKSLDELTIKKDSEILRYKELLGSVEKQLFQKTSEYEVLKAENYELNQTVNNMTILNSSNCIEQLEKELQRSQDSLRETQERLKNSDEKLVCLLEKQQEEKAKIMADSNQRCEETFEELDDTKQKLEEVLKNYNQLEFENNDLKLKLFEYEEVVALNSSLKEKLKLAAEENKKTAEEMTQIRKNFFISGKELLEKNRLTIDQSKIIKEQEQQIKTLEESLTTAFEDIKRLHLNFEEAKKSDETIDLPPVKKNDEVDVKLREIMIKTKVPIKFIRIGEGLYIFGSKRVHVKILNSKLVIRIGGGYMYVEEFIRLYAHQELAKLRSREDAQLSDTEQEENSLEMRNNQLLQQEESDDQIAREIDQYRDTEFRIIAGSTPNLERSPLKKKTTERNIHTSFLDNRRSSTENRSFLTQDLSTQSYNDNVVYEIGPKGGHALPLPKGTSIKDRTPERKRLAQYEPLTSLRIPEPEKCGHKYPDLASARDTLSSARGHSRRSIA